MTRGEMVASMSKVRRSAGVRGPKTKHVLAALVPLLALYLLALCLVRPPVATQEALPPAAVRHGPVDQVAYWPAEGVQVGTLPADVKGQGSEGAPDPRTLHQIEEQVIHVRGLAKQAEVLMRLVDGEGLRSYLVQALDKNYPAHEREIDQKLYSVLGLLKPGESLVQIQLDLLQQSVRGLYDPEEKAMYVVTAPGTHPGELSPEEQFTFAHEFTHALQDQHYDLPRLAPNNPDNVDRSLAVHALLEGDAVVLTVLWARANLTAPQIRRLVEQSGSGNGTPAQPAPRFLGTRTAFLYLGGFAFASQAYERAGGYAGVDELFLRPPASTEQILHPEKYWANEQPVEVALPDLSSRLGEGWHSIGSNVFGELDVRFLLEEHGDSSAAARGAAGWGGGRWQLLEKGGRQAVVLRTTWDSEQDAREFFETYAGGLRVRFGDATQEEFRGSRQALTAPLAATDLRLNGREVLAVITFDRGSAAAIVAAVEGF